MSDIIHLLPEAVANQIAAGEVVQRPASAVKELLENAIDAGATVIQLLVKDAGKTLIQVTDNGKGMSETDARMSFERHATSKIRKIDDLFSVMTKGFRGEALASIAAIAQVELKTKQKGASLGTRIQMEGSKIKSQEPEACAEGTSFLVRNLFFNVPARRYFLKSDTIELRHVMDEFQRVVLTHPEVEFSFHHNDNEIYHLHATSLRQRIVHLFGARYNERLVPVDEVTDIVQVSGFIGKPDAAKKTRGEQFFFVNHRFIKNSYLHHAVMTAFQELIQPGTFPFYVLYLDIDPAQIDINIHPTKTEIKFQDERSIYAILHAAVRRAIGKFSLSPSIDFNQETAIYNGPARAGQEVKIPQVKVNPEYNPFEAKPTRDNPINAWFREREQSSNWRDVLEIKNHVPASNELIQSQLEWNQEDGDIQPYQLHRRYVLFQNTAGLAIVDQQRAHQRVLFEKYMRQINQGKGLSQQLLFAEVVEMQPADRALLLQHVHELTVLGFQFGTNNPNQIEVSGVPADALTSNVQQVMEEFVELLKNEASRNDYPPHEQVAWAMARSFGIKHGQMLTVPEMKELIKNLYQCEMPFVINHQKNINYTISLLQLEQHFRL
jgi:DNA mismatch repair protein MutL